MLEELASTSYILIYELQNLLNHFVLNSKNNTATIATSQSYHVNKMR